MAKTLGIFFKTVAVERLSKKLRDFAKKANDLSAIALADAVEEIVMPKLNAAMINEDGKYGTKFKHIWSETLLQSLSYKVDRKPDQKYNSAIIGFDGTVPYTRQFLKGEDHKDWPLDRMTDWIMGKEKLDDKKLAKSKAKKVIKKLEKEGQVPYQKVIFDELHSKTNKDLQNALREEFRKNLQDVFSSSPSSSWGSTTTEEIPF